MIRFLYLLILLHSTCILRSAEIYGIVKDSSNAPLPFVNVYIKGTTIGCGTNENGAYSLTVDPGNYIVIFQSLGYNKKEIAVSITSENRMVNIILSEQSKLLTDITVFSDSEDPAFEIIRNAIELREKHLKEIKNFTCDVYIKGLQKITESPDYFLGLDFKTIFDLDSNNSGVIYLSESISKYTFEYPNKSKEMMIASKVSGDSSRFSWNDAKSMDMNFYENLIRPNGLTERKLISPIAQNAMFYYNYELQGSFQENNETVYKIKVIPKRTTDPVFNGEIYILENDYRIHSNALFLTKNNGIEFIDTFFVKQAYVETENHAWVLLTNQFHLTFSIFGIKGNGYFIAFYKNYILNQELDPKFFGPEISTVIADANRKENIFWDNSRPIPLTNEEIKDYLIKDSIFKLKNTDAYKDSIQKIYNTPDLNDLLTGYSIKYWRKNLSLHFLTPLEILSYNTIEGQVIDLQFWIDKDLIAKKKVTINPNLHYARGPKALSSYVNMNYLYNNFSKSYFNFGFGKKIKQVNETGISKAINTFSTLFLEENYLKLYDSKYFYLEHGSEIFNGFYFINNIKFENRNLLKNLENPISYFDFIQKEFSSNSYPFLSSDSIELASSITSFSLKAKYAIGQKYLSEPNEKYIVDQKYPTLHVEYRKAISGIYNSKSNFDFIQFAIEDKISLGIQGNINYSILCGGFIQQNTLSFYDFHHFNGNETFFSKLTPNAFNILPYYTFSTHKTFAEAHFIYHTDGFLFNKVPFFKELKLQPIFAIHSIYTHDLPKPYIEYAVGFEHLLKIIKVDFAITPYHFDTLYSNARQFKVLVGFGF